MHLAAPSEHMHGYQWQDRHAAGYLSLQLQSWYEIREAVEAFTDWLAGAEAYLPEEMAEWAKLLIKGTEDYRDVLMMVDFVAESYRRHLERAKQAA